MQSSLFWEPCSGTRYWTNDVLHPHPLIRTWFLFLLLRRKEDDGEVSLEEAWLARFIWLARWAPLIWLAGFIWLALFIWLFKLAS